MFSPLWAQLYADFKNESNWICGQLLGYLVAISTIKIQQVGFKKFHFRRKKNQQYSGNHMFNNWNPHEWPIK